MNSQRVKKIIVLGIDGATYRVLDRPIDWGIMPNLASIFQEGVRGDIISTLPPMTGPAWAAFATGKNPAKHGCFNFFLPTRTLNDSKIISSKDLRGQTFYEILENGGKTCILINLPVSWPPRLKTGITIGSLLAPPDDFLYPKTLINEIPELNEYQLFPDFFLEYRGSDREYVAELRKIERVRFSVAQKLFRREWDFYFLLFSAVDWLQHRFLKELVSPALKKDSFLLDLFKDIDGYLGWFLENRPPEAPLFLLSDHGFKVYSGRFYLNRWLKNNGFLTVARQWDGHEQPHDAAKDRIVVDYSKSLVIKLARRTATLVYKIPLLYGASGWAMRVLNRRFPGRFERDLGDAGDAGLGVDPQKTLAYSVLGNFGQIYINQKGRFENGIVPEEEGERIKNDLIRMLKALRTPEGKKAAKAVYAKEEIFSGPLLDQAPDIILESGDFWIKPSLHPLQVFMPKKTVSHDREGIFGYLGPGADKVSSKKIELYDFAPTILKLFGIQMPKDGDGKCLL